MSFAGTYKQASQENYDEFMKAIGIPDDLIEKSHNIQSVTNIEQNGNHFIVTITISPQVIRNEFNIGEEAELMTLTGDKIRATVNLEEGKLAVNLKGVYWITELCGDDLITTSTYKEIMYKKVSKRTT